MCITHFVTIQLKCCGLKGPLDWVTEDYFIEYGYPGSCECDTNDYDDGSCYIAPIVSLFTDTGVWSKV